MGGNQWQAWRRRQRRRRSWDLCRLEVSKIVSIVARDISKLTGFTSAGSSPAVGKKSSTTGIGHGFNTQQSPTLGLTVRRVYNTIVHVDKYKIFKSPSCLLISNGFWALDLNAPVVSEMPTKVNILSTYGPPIGAVVTLPNTIVRMAYGLGDVPNCSIFPATQTFFQFQSISLRIHIWRIAYIRQPLSPSLFVFETSAMVLTRKIFSPHTAIPHFFTFSKCFVVPYFQLHFSVLFICSPTSTFEKNEK